VFEPAGVGTIRAMQAERNDRENGDRGPGGPLQRVGAVAGVIATLDRRIVDLFESIDELRRTSTTVSQLSDEGADFLQELRERLDRIEAKVRIDTDEVKNAVLEKLGEVDVQGIGPRLDGVEKAIFNIETAVTRLDKLVSGMVESVPDFITRRVRARALNAEDDPLT